jgi:2-keto-4-pentenoate hydratase/2-oxohepta-3-ene-1,7-dioic acid hydratase in catechol pathway
MQTITVGGRAMTPSKIVCIGRNYAAHIEELGNEIPDDMVVFIKPNSAIGQTLYAELGERLHFEGELAFVIQDNKLAAVGFGLDLTKRALQSKLKQKGLPWERAKAFDGAALFSEFVALPPDINTLSLKLTINGEIRQHGGVPLMMYPPNTIVSELASFTTLEDGDIIMTGTPAGVGEVSKGDTFTGAVLAGDQLLVSTSWQAI